MGTWGRSSPATLDPADKPRGDRSGGVAAGDPSPPLSPRASCAGSRVAGLGHGRAATLDPADEPRHDKGERAAAAAANEPGRRRAAANGNVPNEPEPAGPPTPPRRSVDDPTPAERLEIEAMIASGEPALILEAAARTGILDQVAPLFAATAAARGRPPSRTAQ